MTAVGRGAYEGDRMTHGGYEVLKALPVTPPYTGLLRTAYKAHTVPLPSPPLKFKICYTLGAASLDFFLHKLITF